ncbi:MAG: 4Fe-4S dicluster domain-containing protein [bacterium]|nr:4Fe-4S dicluster domain-containing protein [bacterium]
MFEIQVNNRIVDANSDETIYEALNRAGIKIPTLCHMKELLPTGACRICSVEVEGMNGLIPSCSYPVHEGMKITTNSPRVILARKTIIELLLSNHPDDCLYCVRNGSCHLQDLAREHEIRGRRYALKEKNRYNLDMSSPAIIREQSKCILCGKCVRVCEEIQNISAIDFVGRGSKTVIAPAFEAGLNVSNCINCGQCVLACPTGALKEQTYIKEIMNALEDPGKIVVVQHAPAVSVTLAEEFGMKPGVDINGLMVSALRRMGFNKVFDTSFGADLTIIEEASELVSRIKDGGVLPMFTSCSPGWVKYVEQYYPDMLKNLSTCKSPHQMVGAMAKSYFAELEDIDPKNIYTVSVMPCTAKKFESSRPEMSSENMMDVDATLSTREIARMIRMFGIDFDSLTYGVEDLPFSKRSTAGKLFAGTGGVMEAALRTAYFYLTGEEAKTLHMSEVRGLGKIKEKYLEINGMKLGFAVVNGIGNAKKLLDEIKDGRNDLHFIEVMTCPGGCIGGGGQPINTDINKIKARMKALHAIDKQENLRTSHNNELIRKIYKDYLGEPLGKRSHKLLHTKYNKREVYL